MIELRTSCAACSSSDLTEIYRANDVPVHCNILYDDEGTARRAPRGDIVLAFCGACGLVFNTAFEPELTAYSESYENSLYFSPAFRDYAERLTDHLVSEFGLHDKDLVEIGCGSAEFLISLCEKGANRGFGFDPSAPPSSSPLVTIVPEFYGPAHAGVPADAVFSRHVLEHVADPGELVANMRAAVTPGTRVYCEVPNARFVLETPSVWDIIYEHPTYFAAETLGRLFHAHGFAVDACYPGFGGQFLSLEGTATDPSDAAAVDATDLAQTVDRFRSAQAATVAGWTAKLSSFPDGDVAIWGAGSKGVTFLNLIPGADKISFVIDVNPRKHGKHVPGTGQMVEGPEALLVEPPGLVLVMNPLYEQEIAAELKRLGLDTTVEVVS